MKIKRIPGSRRFEDWPARLGKFLVEHRSKPFAWGANDCCLFACNGIRAIIGLDPAAGKFRGQYRGAAGAVRLLKKEGGVEAIAERVCRELGFMEWPAVAQARRGDLVLRETPDGPALGVCDGHLAVFHGSAVVRLTECRRAWRID